MISFAIYNALLSKYCAANLRKDVLTAAEWAKITEYETAHPQMDCPHCETRQRSQFEPYRVVHPIDECKTTRKK